jgi:hypothetical protein
MQGSRAVILLGLVSFWACSGSPSATETGGNGNGGQAGASQGGGAGNGGTPGDAAAGASDGTPDGVPPIWSDRFAPPSDGPSDASRQDVIGQEGGSTGAFYPPDAKLVYVGQGPSAGLEIVGANLIAPTTPSGSSRWLVAVHNGGTNPICYVMVAADFKSANGTVLFSATMNIDGETYSNAGSSNNCIGPGKTGMGLWLKVGAPADPSTIDRIEYGFPGSIVPSAVPANRVSLTNVRAEMGGLGWVVKGTATATQPVRFVFVDVYPKNAAGRPLEQLVISNAALAGGASWDFTTTSWETSFSDYYLQLTYTFP